jgi:hypothetical protein
MTAARAVGGARIAMAQAASGAILTVVVANGEAGTERLEEALIGAGVALVFSQFLSPRSRWRCYGAPKPPLWRTWQEG